MIRGMQQSTYFDDIDLQLDIPSITALKFMNGEVDVALLPVGVLPQLNDYRIITNYCIGAHDRVKSVALFSKVPLNQIEIIWLDYHSRTSVELLKILLKEYWQLPAIKLKVAGENAEELIEGNAAALLIGDKTFPLINSIPYQYDLASAWNELTGLPFVFACWVAKSNFSIHREDELNQAFSLGINFRNQIISELKLKDLSTDWNDYFYHCIQYQLDEPKKKALKLFLTKINS